MNEQHRSKLSDARLKAMHREPTKGKHADGTVPGLYIEVTAAGNLLWRLKYRLHGKENRAALGAYPDVGLAEARRRAQEARTLIANGTAPVEHKRAQEAAQAVAAAQTFEAVAREWLKSRTGKLSAQVHAQYGRVLERLAYPKIGSAPVSAVKLADVLSLVRAVGDKPTMSRLVLRLCESVFEYAEAHELVERNVLAGKRQTKIDALPPARTANRAGMTDPAQVGGFLRAIEAYRTRGTGAVLDALRFLVMVPARPAEVCALRWADVDLDAGTWTYRMGKVDRVQTMHLPAQAVELLRAREGAGNGAGWVFPSPVDGSRPIARNALLAAIRRLGFDPDECTAHGWRATFRTLGAEVLGIAPDVLELALGHKLADRHRGAYNRVTLEAQRRDAAQQWADYLDSLRG